MLVFSLIWSAILTAFEYDRQEAENQLGPNLTSAEQIPNVSLSTHGIIRPKKKSSRGK